MDEAVEVREVEYAQERDSIMAIRFSVFVDEQGVPADLEIDEMDPESRHVLAFNADQPVATGRLLPDGHIGRVAVSKTWRQKGVGCKVMQRLIEMAREADLRCVVISAQVSAKGFYERLGFLEKGDIYLEAGIDHIEMELPFS
ncbi:GNAT family N-acetyltransferase [Pelagicoccus sp. SDUM812003]|uniref:GNAT family N-acetyltransferase n=1 Tax=Pelagicoccus sp. SDUM812003 TaxID=3041267 RepID=UPI00280FD4FD|nr:GNAT family N-acetyltransferase [Pelagicoccus sp. SDUM812003]MDQ8203158.1 GNAT family N-acetyltransferase [Pelagicoccus sp. SDUM812003]